MNYLLCLWISRSNFENASQEKFSPVSKVLHRIQNKFSDSQSATVCQIFVSASIWYFIMEEQEQEQNVEHSEGEIRFLFCSVLLAFGLLSRAFFVLPVFVENPVSSVLPPFLKWFSFDLRSLAALPPSL